MIDKKYTDEDIISSLQVIATTCNCNECKIRNCKWGTCNCSQITANAALELINRQESEQESEIERLKKEASVARDAYIAIQDRYEYTKTEAYKECLAKVKNYIKTHCNPYGKPDFDYDTSIRILNFIDNILKEMTEVNENDDTKNNISTFDGDRSFR